MQKVLLIPVILGVAAAFSFVGLMVSDTHDYDNTDIINKDRNIDSSNTDLDTADVFGKLFTYYDIEHLSAKLSQNELYLSTPVPITDHTIARYCLYYDPVHEAVKSVSYCTTSGIDNQNGITIGNVNLGGDTTHPVMALAVLDPIDSLEKSERGSSSAVAVFEGMVAAFVCDDCWEDQNPGGFESIYAWMHAIESMLDDTPDQDTLRSSISGFKGQNGDHVEMMLEATATLGGGYQWTFTILQ